MNKKQPDLKSEFNSSNSYKKQTKNDKAKALKKISKALSKLNMK